MLDELLQYSESLGMGKEAVEKALNDKYKLFLEAGRIAKLEELMRITGFRPTDGIVYKKGEIGALKSLMELTGINWS